MTKRELTITGLALMIAAGLWYKLEGCVASQQVMLEKQQALIEEHKKTVDEYRTIIFEDYRTRLSHDGE